MKKMISVLILIVLCSGCIFSPTGDENTTKVTEWKMEYSEFEYLHQENVTLSYVKGSDKKVLDYRGEGYTFDYVFWRNSTISQLNPFQNTNVTTITETVMKYPSGDQRTISYYNETRSYDIEFPDKIEVGDTFNIQVTVNRTYAQFDNYSYGFPFWYRGNIDYTINKSYFVDCEFEYELNSIKYHCFQINVNITNTMNITFSNFTINSYETIYYCDELDMIFYLGEKDETKEVTKRIIIQEIIFN